MPNTKEIKKRIKSVEDTHKITNAMYLIASTKLKKAKSDFDHTRPYFNALRAEIKRMFRVSRDVDSNYFYPVERMSADKTAYIALIITADKGLAGAYNQNVIKQALKLIDEYPTIKLYVVGEYGRHYFKEHNIKIEQSFLYTAQNPNMHRAREIADILLEEFNKYPFAKLFVMYTDLESGMVGETKFNRILPFHRAQFTDTQDEKKVVPNLTYYPSLADVLEYTVKSYVTGYIYSALIDSFCCEQEARMMAMSSANDNAKKILNELQMQYNQVRQAQITQEITEISAGAKARLRKEER